jgi:hypothetical protein
VKNVASVDRRVEMASVPDSVADFLRGRRFAVAGVSRDGKSVGNAIFRKLRQAGYEVVPVNPAASEVEGVRSFPDLAAVPGSLDGVVVATHPDASIDIVRQCADRGIGRVWLHRSIGRGSVSAAAVQLCRERGIQCIAGGCPLLYCAPVDVGHRCMGWWLRWSRRIPR